MTRFGLRHWFREAVLFFTGHLVRQFVRSQNLGRPSAVGVEEDFAGGTSLEGESCSVKSFDPDDLFSESGRQPLCS